MAEYYQFAHSVQGYNHIKANKVCQDASGECHFEDVSIIAVADGHGSDNYIRTDRGSKFAVSAALTAIKAFVQEARENHLSAVPDSETELIQISKNILARWYTQVENDVACEPFQPKELAKVLEKYKQRYASGQYNAKAYGTTLIAVCMTNEGWFGIHIGDGKCVELLENGTLCEPIPWDEACEQNITTSICDSDAIEEFRYIIQKDFPAAIFIGSDGIDDSYSSEMELHELYRNIFIVFAEHSTEIGSNEVRDYLPKITRRGSGDDVSIAGIIRTDLSEDAVAKIIYKKYVDSTNQSLEDFVTAFHDKNLDGSSSNAENQLLGYQQQQTELMKNFATVVSEAVSTSIANTMRTELVPIFDEMKSTVKEFSEIASQQQKDGLNQVVQEFIRCMNESLRGQFDELAATIQKTCEWQKASTEQMQKIVDSICDTSNEIEKVNAVSHQTVEEMNGFVTLLKEYQEKLHSEAELIQQQIANSNEISERQANYLDKLVESESRVADLADNVKKEADAAQQAVDMLSDHCKDQISGIVDAAKQDMDALAASTKVLTEASHSQMETLAQTAESEMQLLSNTAAQLSEENHKQLMELTKASSEQMSVISEAANNVMQNSKQQIEEAIKATQAQSDALMQATNDFSDFVQQEHKKLVEAVDKEVSGLSNFAGQTTSEIQSATAGMENAAKLLDKNLDDVLDRTFTSFDSSLTDISQHLSGTIADVRDTTEALPHVIRESQKQYEAVLAKLTSQTQTYLDAMEKLTALVEQKAPVTADEEGNRQ